MLFRLSTLALTGALVFGACADEPAATATPTSTQAFEACEGHDFTIIAPVEGRAWTPNAITLTSEELAPGVFAVYDSNAADYSAAGFPLATSGGFVIGDDGVLLVETMINRQLFCQMIDLVRAETDKPVLYAVNTSHHGDHSYGNHFLPSDVKVVQHAETTAFITNPESFAGDVAFMEYNFGDDQGMDEIEARPADIIVDDSGWSVDLGGITVNALYLGFGQTHGDLFVTVPGADVLWTGNPIVAAAPAIPWLLDGNAQKVLATLQTLKADFPFATLVAGHDAPKPATLVDFPIAYLTALIAETQAAIDAGQTLEQATDSVTLDDYQGYALWDWVHSAVNLPATYAELSAN